MAEEWDDELTAAVGRIAIASASLEFAASLAFKRLLQSDRAELVAMGQPWRTVYESCRALIETSELTESMKSLDTTLKTADELYGRRNRVIHGYWINVAEGKPPCCRNDTANVPSTSGISRT